jgi:serine/threonine protein kinase
MPVPATCEQFLEIVEKSLVLDKDRLEDYFQKKPELPPDAKELANQLWRDGLLTFYQARMLLSGKYKGFVFGKYKVLEQIGAGGEGNVYLCEHLLMRRRVAVKVLPIDRAADPALLERFYREARAAAALDHPNIVRVHDIDQEGELHFLVMEYVDGHSLHKIVRKKGPMEILRAVNYVRQSAIGLEHVHEAGLVHRDIKPGNLLLDRQGTIKILDLGLARFFHDHKDALTRQYDESAILGTADYISPEQGMNSHEVDIRSDIYSLGATFYYMLAGRAPFDGGNVTQKLLFHQIREPEPIRKVRVAVPEEMGKILARMMAKDPSARYQSPIELVEALTPWLQELPPPPEEEMPKLSLMIGGNSDTGPLSKTLGQLSSHSSRILKRTEPPSTKRLHQAKTLVLPTAEVIPEPAASLPVRSNGTVVPARARSSVPAPRKQTNQALAETEPAGGSETRSSRRPKKRRFKLKSVQDNKLFYLSLAGGGVVVLGITAYLVLPLVFGNWGLSNSVDIADSGRSAPPPAAPAPPAADPGINREAGLLQVTKHGASGASRTVGEALAKATPGSRILVFAQDGIHEELLRIDKKIANDITIEGDTRSGKALVWRAPGGGGDALIHIANAEGLKFKGIVFDGQDRTENLFVLAGSCPGVTLEETTLRGFRRVGVAFRDCVAEARKPAALVRARIFASRDADAGLLFEGSNNRDIDVRDCRIEGPFRSAIQIAASVDGVGFHRNRIFKTHTGLLYRRAERPHRARLELVSNTFYEVARGLHFETVPPGGDNNEIVVQRNLFARVQTPVLVDDFAPEPDVITAQWIWFNEPSGDPMKFAPPGATYFRRSFMLPEQTFSGVSLSIACDDEFTAYVNGQQVGRGEYNAATRRVYAFDVSRQLRGGLNVIAVHGVNKVTGRGATPAGLLVHLSDSGPNPVLVASDGQWKSSKSADPGWHTDKFNDSAWNPVRVLASYGKGDATWQNLVWDVAAGAKFKGGITPFVNPKTNVRDGSAQTSFPPLEWKGMHGLNLPADPNNDRQFLRYAKSHPLAKAGPGDSSVGAPPVD